MLIEIGDHIINTDTIQDVNLREKYSDAAGNEQIGVCIMYAGHRLRFLGERADILRDFLKGVTTYNLNEQIRGQ